MQQRQSGEPRTYSTSQVVLHWTIAVLVVAQLVTQSGMEEAWRAWRRAGEADPNGLAYAHVAIGVTVLLLSILRFAIRMRRGAPPIPESHPQWLRVIAGATHVLLYAFIFLMPLTGAIAWFGGVDVSAEVHEFGASLLVPLVGLHALGGLAEHFVFRTNALRRILGLPLRDAAAR